MTHQLHPTRRAFMASSGAAVLSLKMIGSARAEDALKITVTSTSGLAGLVLQELAISLGFIKEQGLEPNFLHVQNSGHTVAALIGGSADMCIWSGLNSVPVAIEHGAPLKIIAGSLLFPTHAVFTARPGIHTVSDLVGKTIGVGAIGAQLHLVMLALLTKKGVDPKKVTFRNVGSSTDVFRAVAAGTVDAGPSEANNLAIMEKFHVHTLKDGDLWKEVPEFTFQASYASDDAIAKKREAIVQTLAAFCKTYRFLSGPNSKDAWVKAFIKVTGKSDSAEEAVKQWTFTQKYQPYDVGLTLGPERIEFMQKLNLELGVQKKILPYDKVADMSLAHEALKRVG